RLREQRPLIAQTMNTSLSGITPPIRRSSPMTPSTQDKQKEISFFDGHAAANDYDVFTPQASARLVDAFVKLTRLKPGARVIDLGCGSGTFTPLLARPRYDSLGLDISAKSLQVAPRTIRASTSPLATSRTGRSA